MRLPREVAIDNQELVAKIDEVVEALLAIERHLGEIVTREREREALHREILQQEALMAAQEPAPVPGAIAGWPWTPDTVTQGFLSARWLRRDGTGYTPSAAAVQGPNSPIRGGDDANARVDVPSGAPRVAPYGPT